MAEPRYAGRTAAELRDALVRNVEKYYEPRPSTFGDVSKEIPALFVTDLDNVIAAAKAEARTAADARADAAERALIHLRFEVGDCVYGLRFQPEISRHDIADALARAILQAPSAVEPRDD